jgi:hypothetical protein
VLEFRLLVNPRCSGRLKAVLQRGCAIDRLEGYPTAIWLDTVNLELLLLSSTKYDR